MFKGVLINAALVIIGTMAGLIFKGEKLKRVGQRIFEAFAIFVIVMGVSGSINLDNPLLILASIIIGVCIGELIDIDEKFTQLGNFMQQKFAKNDQGFSRGFIEASLLFCIGSMTILGALQSGLEHEHTIYITKGILDMVSAMTFAMGLRHRRGLLSYFCYCISRFINPFRFVFSTCIKHRNDYLIINDRFLIFDRNRLKYARYYQNKGS